MTDRDLAADLRATEPEYIDGDGRTGDDNDCYEEQADRLIALGWTRLDGTPEELEAVAGRLLVASGKARAERMGPNDAHELRHLLAIIETGNSDGCEGAFCALDGQIKALNALDEERLARAMRKENKRTADTDRFSYEPGEDPIYDRLLMEEVRRIAKAYQEDEG